MQKLSASDFGYQACKGWPSADVIPELMSNNGLGSIDLQLFLLKPKPTMNSILFGGVIVPNME